MLNLLDLVKELWPLHRTLASDGTDRALQNLVDTLSPLADARIEAYESGSEAWTWTVPERYDVREAFVETEDGERVIDFAVNPLHLMSYSDPVDALLSWEELEPHLRYAEHRSDAIPWEALYYSKGWGFCLTKTAFDALPRDTRYRVVIRTDSGGSEAGFRVGVCCVDPKEGRRVEAGEILVCAHICHPAQANDDLSGVATAVGLATRLAERPLPPGSMSVRFLFCPETIGSICYFANNEEVIGHLRHGIFCEMTGNENALSLQRSFPGGDLVDRVARYVFKRRFERFDERGFREGIANDEMVINGPGVDCPCISVTRWPYDEYHTSDDTPEILSEERLQESVDLVEDIVRILASNYVPRRTFKGPVFLSRYGLWVDWRDDRELNHALEMIMLRLEGDRTVFDIAEEFSLDYWDVRAFIEKLRANGLVEADPVGRRGV